MEVFLVYLWLKIDTFSATMFVIGAVLMSMLSWYFIKLDFAYYQSEKEEVQNKWWKTVKRNFFIGFSCVLVSIATPSANQVAILVGTSYAVDFAKSPEGAKIGQLIRKKANDFLDEELKEIKPANKAGDPQ